MCSLIESEVADNFEETIFLTKQGIQTYEFTVIETVYIRPAQALARKNPQNGEWNVCRDSHS